MDEVLNKKHAHTTTTTSKTKINNISKCQKHKKIDKKH